jgi:hypothetical protein
MKVRAVLALAAAIAFAMTATADDSKGHKPAKKSAGLEQFKQLAGEWVGKMKDENNQMRDVTTKYAVTSAGSAVVETMGAGTPHEMVNVIHQDGGDLALTHYCAIGNQPHMKAADKPGQKFEFVFTSGSNMASDHDGHMHSVTYTLVDKDTLQEVWTFYEGGKKSGTATFDYKRKK